jgi:Rrf2 family protein
MVQLARHYGTGPASLAGIAAEEDLPRAYLEQLVVNLREAGLVVSTRGARGGYELTRAPETILMSEVLRALEGPIAPMMCATDDPEHAVTCDRSARCTVNVLWVRVRDVTGAPTRLTLADLVPPRVPTIPTTPRSDDRPSDRPVHRPASRHPRPPRRDRGEPRARDPSKASTSPSVRARSTRSGPNGSGKTTPAYALDGPPGVPGQGRHGHWKGRDILKLSPDKRARLGLFLAFQYPTASRL